MRYSGKEASTRSRTGNIEEDIANGLESSFNNTFDESIFERYPDLEDIEPPRPLPDAETLRLAYVSGNLISIQPVLKTHWLDRPADERIDKGKFGASSLCECIERDDVNIASYLLSNVVSMHKGHFAMATKQKSYSFLALCLRRG